MSIKEKCLQVLREGPATAFDIALELELRIEQVQDCLKKQVARGVVVTRPFLQLLPHEQPRARQLYELVDYGVEA